MVVCHFRPPHLFVPWGANISQSLERRGGANNFVKSSGDYGDDDVLKETDVSKANIAVSEAGKLSAGARTFKGPNN